MCEFLLIFLNPRKKTVKEKKNGIWFKECCKDKVTGELDLKDEFTKEMNWVNISGTENSITQIIQDLKSTMYLSLSQ